MTEIAIPGIRQKRLYNEVHMKKLLCLLISSLPIVVCAQSWQILNPRPTDDELRCVFFFNSQPGYIAVDSGVIAAADPFMNVICITTAVPHDPQMSKNPELKQTDHTVEFVLPDPFDFIVSAEIYNLTGTEVRSSGKGIQMISTAGLSKGIYFYHILTNKQLSCTGKFCL